MDLSKAHHIAPTEEFSASSRYWFRIQRIKDTPENEQSLHG